MAEVAEFFFLKLIKIYLIDRNVSVFEIAKSAKSLHSSGGGGGFRRSGAGELKVRAQLDC